MNTNCDKITENLDNSEDEYGSDFQKIMILKVIQQIFCEIIIGDRKYFYTNLFFEVTNTRKNVKMIFQSLKYNFTNWYPRNHL